MLDMLDEAPAWAGAVVALIGLVLAAFGAWSWRLCQQVRGARLVSVAGPHAGQGPRAVALRGQAETPPEGPLAAPLTGRPCHWFSFRVEALRKQAGQDQERWVEIERGTSLRPILLRDATGLASIDPAGATMTGTETEGWTSDGPPPAAGMGEALATIASVAIQGRLETRRYTEEVIPAGAPLFVLGSLTPAPAGPAAVRAPESGYFAISTLSPEATARRHLLAAAGQGAGAAVLVGVGVFMTMRRRAAGP